MITVKADRSGAAVVLPNFGANGGGNHLDDVSRLLVTSLGLVVGVALRAAAGAAKQALTATSATPPPSATAATTALIAVLRDVQVRGAGVILRLEKQVLNRIKPGDQMFVFFFLRCDLDDAIIDIERQRADPAGGSQHEI